MEQPIQRPLVRRVTDDDDFTAVPSRGKVTEKVAHLVHELAVTLPVRVGLVDVPASFSGEDGYCHAVQGAVVAFAQPSVLNDRNPATVTTAPHETNTSHRCCQ